MHDYFIEQGIEAHEVGSKGDKEYYVTGYISTPDLDIVGEIITEECLDDMYQQIKSNQVPIKFDIEHQTFTEGTLDINPIAKVVETRRDKKGIWVKAQLNKFHSKFKEVWGSVKSGFLDAFSIYYVTNTKDRVKKYEGGKSVTLLNRVKLLNVTLTGTPVNPAARIEQAFAKSLTALKTEDEENKEEIKEEITSHSPEKSEEKSTKMAEVETEQKPEENVEPTSEETEKSEQVEDKVEEKSETESEAKEEQPENNEVLAEVKSLKGQISKLEEENASLKAKLDKALDEPQIKSTVQNMPQKQLNLNDSKVNALDLIR